jgi:hypothetical protein
MFWESWDKVIDTVLDLLGRREALQLSEWFNRSFNRKLSRYRQIDWLHPHLTIDSTGLI